VAPYGVCSSAGGVELGARVQRDTVGIFRVLPQVPRSLHDAQAGAFALHTQYTEEARAREESPESRHTQTICQANGLPAFRSRYRPHARAEAQQIRGAQFCLR